MYIHIYIFIYIERETRARRVRRMKQQQEDSHKLVRLIVTAEEQSMAKGKIKSLAIKLISAAGTGFFYVTTKNPNNVKHKLALRKVQNDM